MTTVFRIVDSPIGPLTIAGDRDDTVTHLCMDGQAHAPVARENWTPSAKAFDHAAEQLREYFQCGRQTFDFPMSLRGTPFQLRVWDALRSIPYGETASYADIATAVGNPAACRAVGLANGRNPIAIVVPCHRVIGKSGALTGYGGGLARKEQLLALERELVRAQ